MKKLLIIEDTLRHQMAAKAQFPEAEVVDYDEAYKILRKARVGEISAILTDLHFMVRESWEGLGGAPFIPLYKDNMAAIGTQMPFGLAFVLKGIELQVPVALYSDRDHHRDLITGLLDMFGQHRPLCPRFVLLKDGSCQMAKDMWWDGKNIVCEPLPEKPEYTGDDEGEKRHADWLEKRVKDWRVALEWLNEVVKL